MFCDILLQMKFFMKLFIFIFINSCEKFYFKNNLKQINKIKKPNLLLLNYIIKSVYHKL